MINAFVVDAIYHCMNCPRRYTRKNNLKRHMAIECGKKPQYFCKYCSSGFKYRYVLTRHIQLKHILNAQV